MRDNDTNHGSGGAHIKPADYIRTDNQLLSHESFTPEHITPRGDLAVSSSGLPTMLLAVPPSWTHRDDLPCTTRVQRGNGPDLYDTNDSQRARALCAGCPVKQACLDDALREEAGLGPRSRYLVRGGITPRRRGLMPLPE